MKRTMFNKIPVGVKSETVDKIVKALCSSPAITRAEIAERSGASLTTVCKVADALISSGTVNERIKAQSDSSKRKPCGHLSVNRRLCTAVIDLSSPIYSVSLICGGASYFHHAHKYDASVSFEDNLYSLLSRAFANMHLKKDFCLQICVLYSDMHGSALSPQVYLPSLCDKEVIDRAVYGVCKRLPISYISKPQAVSAAVKFNIVSKADGLGGVSHLSVGSVISGFSVLKSGTVVTCRPQDLIVIDGVTAEIFAKSCVTRGDFELLLEKAVNFIDSAFGAQTLIIESDIFEIDATYIKSLERKFARMRLSLPIIYPIYLSADHPGICVLSAARQAEATLVRTYVITDGKPSN